MNFDTQLSLPASLSGLFEEIYKEHNPLDETGLYEKIRAILPAPQELTSEQKKACWAELSAFSFYNNSEARPDFWNNTYFLPLSSGKKATGEFEYFPDANEIDVNIINYWKSRAKVSTHPTVKARYADLAWDFAKMAGENADIDMARIAQAAYLDIIEKKLFIHEPSAWDYIERAIMLSLSIGDNICLERAKAVLFGFYREMYQSNQKFMWWRISNIVSSYKKLSITDSEFQEITSGLETILMRTSNLDDKDNFNPHQAQDAANRLAKNYVSKGLKEEAHRVIRIAGHAFESAADKATGLLAITWLEDVARKYHNNGLTVDAVRVQKKIIERAPEAQIEMQRIETPIEFEKEKFEAWVASVVVDDLQDSLLNIGREFLILEENVRDIINETSKVAPLSATINLNVVNHQGITVAELGSVEDDMDGRMIFQAAQLISIGMHWLNAVFSRLKEKHTITADTILGFLERKPFFPPDRHSLLLEGLNAWLSGDAVKAIHVLIPQLESALRDILESLGGLVWKPQKETSGFDAITMGAILNSKEFQDRFTSDGRFYLKALYTDQRGLNLRNTISHGLCSHRFMHMGIANWVVHSLLLLGGLKINENQPTQSTSDNSIDH